MPKLLMLLFVLLSLFVAGCDEGKGPNKYRCIWCDETWGTMQRHGGRCHNCGSKEVKFVGKISKEDWKYNYDHSHFRF